MLNRLSGAPSIFIGLIPASLMAWQISLTSSIFSLTGPLANAPLPYDSVILSPFNQPMPASFVLPLGGPIDLAVLIL